MYMIIHMVYICIYIHTHIYTQGCSIPITSQLAVLRPKGPDAPEPSFICKSCATILRQIGW
jgi:hypothetical protein